MEIIRYGETCTVKQANSSKTVEAVVFEFKERKNETKIIKKIATEY